MSHEVSQEGMFLLENEEGTGFKGTGRQLLFCACVNCWCCIATHTLPSSEAPPSLLPPRSPRATPPALALPGKTAFCRVLSVVVAISGE